MELGRVTKGLWEALDLQYDRDVGRGVYICFMIIAHDFDEDMTLRFFGRWDWSRTMRSRHFLWFAFHGKA